MPIATLRYRLPEEQAAYDAARAGEEARRVLWEIDQRLRSLVKHGQPSEETRRVAEEIREVIRESPERLLD